MADIKRSYDPKEDQEYQKAMQALEAARQSKPTYPGTYDAQAGSLYEKLQTRRPFAYDINADALYRQYRDQYAALGSRAMEDTMGRAQAMTGGYANSYAQTAGQQAYQQYLGKLNQAIPELYDRALQRYRQEGSDLAEQYRLAQELGEQEYDRHKDALDSYRKDLSFLQGQADQAYQRGYQAYLDDYKRMGDAYAKLAELIKKGYTPTAQELENAGMTQAQAEALRR